MLPRNVGNVTNNLLCVTFHKSEYLKRGLIVVIGELEVSSGKHIRPPDKYIAQHVQRK
jgi:hypothetical protein